MYFTFARVLFRSRELSRATTRACARALYLSVADRKECARSRSRSCPRARSLSPARARALSLPSLSPSLSLALFRLCLSLSRARARSRSLLLFFFWSHTHAYIHGYTYTYVVYVVRNVAGGPGVRLAVFAWRTCHTLHPPPQPFSIQHPAHLLLSRTQQGLAQVKKK